jgi:hypothetical protein
MWLTLLVSRRPFVDWGLGIDDLLMNPGFLELRHSIGG